MMHNGKSSKGMLKPVGLALAAAAVGALSVFGVMKWMQGSVDQSRSSVTTEIPEAQVPAEPAKAPLPAAKPTDLETLVAPIALYPDPLLAQLLPAATYPLEVVQAARWLQANPKATQASGQDWAPSIVALLQFPQVISMMNDKLEWTTQLGDRFLAQPEAVLGAIQSLRERAMTAGLLQDTPEQKITKAVITKVSTADPEVQGTWVEAPAAQSSVPTKQTEVIRIEPANPQVIYVPQYNPQVLYTAPPVQTYSTTTTTTSQTSPWLTYGEGVATGALLGWAISEWSDDDWDDHYHGYYHHPPISHYSGYGGYSGWGGNANINRNINRNVNISGNEINVNRQNMINNRPQATPWTHDPQHRRGYRYTPQAQQRLAANRPKPQPALAGQRKTNAQTANLDYAGFNRDQMDRARQTQVEKTLGQGAASNRRQQDKAAQQRGIQSRNQTKPRVSQQPARQAAQKNAISGAQRNKPAAAQSQRRPAGPTVRPEQRRANVQPRQSARMQPAKSFAQTTPRGSAASRDFASRGAFGGVNEGGRAQAYSQRGQASRAQAYGQSGRSNRPQATARASGGRAGGGGRRR